MLSVDGSSRDTRSDIMEPAQTSPFLALTTSYGFPHGVGNCHSLISFVLGSNRPMALPPYSANHSTFSESTRPRRGREDGRSVFHEAISLVLASRRPMLAPP